MNPEKRDEKELQTLYQLPPSQIKRRVLADCPRLSI
jgi:hypothetical protein